MIVSTTSYGTRQADSCVVRVSGGASSRRRLILTLLRYQKVTTRVEMSVHMVRIARSQSRLRVEVRSHTCYRGRKPS